MARHKADLKRAEAMRAPKRRFIIYCEGENTEPAYFASACKRFVWKGRA